MKKVLIITYYWPPAGGPGVQRWLKFVKYLSRKDYNITVFTVSNGEYPVIDSSLEKDVPSKIRIIKSHILEPFSFYKKLIGQDKKEKINPGFLHEKKKTSILQSLAIWVRGNLFIPDARLFWIRPSVKKLKHLMKEEQFDTLITTGPPHSAHVIGLRLKQYFKELHWIADFRDPWTSIDYFKDLKLSQKALTKHKKLEKKVLDHASKIIVIGEGMKAEFQTITDTPVFVIPNGYDPEDFQTNDANLKSDHFFSITHVGMINKDRNHLIFYKALSELKQENNTFKDLLKIRFAGKLDKAVYQLLDQYDLSENLEYTPYLNHADVFAFEQQASLLYLPINNTPNAKAILTGKIFEYLAAERPILCIGPPDGDAAKIILECEAGSIADFKDLSMLKETITAFFKKHLEGTLQLHKKIYEKYSREKQTAVLERFINNSLND